MRSGHDSMLYVYILASLSRVLYAGCTHDLHRRVYQHKLRLIPGFTSTYKVDRLVWFVCHDEATSGVSRERQIKSWRREKKIHLIESTNAGWHDLAAGWFEPPATQVPRWRSG